MICIPENNFRINRIQFIGADSFDCPPCSNGHKYWSWDMTSICNDFTRTGRGIYIFLMDRKLQDLKYMLEGLADRFDAMDFQLLVGTIILYISSRYNCRCKSQCSRFLQPLFNAGN